jgi:hypothetical protein
MQKYNISLDDLDTLFEKLWETCSDKGYFRVLPHKNIIEVYQYIPDQVAGRQIAEINIITMDDAYDVKDNLFK